MEESEMNTPGEQTSMDMDLIDPDKIELSFKCLKASQPIGDIFIAAMSHTDLCRISHFDVRRVIQKERDVERYLGIQRPLDGRRVKELEEYVNYYDATFPTAVIIAINDQYVRYDEDAMTMTVSNAAHGDESPSVAIRHLARVIDGQHRIAGLFAYDKNQSFIVPVTIFVGSDISDQAYVFSTVNLEQNKVSKSLAYDLFALARTRSPQKTCHNIAVALDQDERSPFFKRIKRLGVATPGRDFETLTQAQFVEALLKYISSDAKHDRDLLLRGKAPSPATPEEAKKYVLRNMFINERDLDIAQLINNYFDAVKSRWPEAWNYRGEGLILNRTNGFRALMRVFRDIYLYLAAPGDIVPAKNFLEMFERSTLEDKQISREQFPPGSSGEGTLVRKLREEILGD